MISGIWYNRVEENPRSGFVREKEMIRAVQRNEFGAWNAGGDFLAQRERDPHIALALGHQRRRLHLRQEAGDVDVRKLHNESLHHFRRRGDPLQVVEPARLLGCPSRDELRGEPLPIGIVLAAPALTNQGSIELDELSLLV